MGGGDLPPLSGVLSRMNHYNHFDVAAHRDRAVRHHRG
jgi:hypothetical protein